MSSNLGNKIIKRVSFNPNSLRKPAFYRLSLGEDALRLDALLDENSRIEVFDKIDAQLTELVRIKNPGKNLSPEDVEQLIKQHTQLDDLAYYGVWVFYPWSNKLVHILDEEEFIAVRTNRNQHKITRKEAEILRSKKIGVIGLSVGQAIALTLVMERCCGEIRIADFDTFDLSNYNRIRTGIHNIGVSKLTTAAREIAEIDPFIKVVCYEEGITEDNIDDFLIKDGKLDLMAEECDSLDIKILSRIKAREYHIPVIMDTNDRGMIDIERFDLNPEYPVLHGLLGDMPYQQLKGLTTEQKIPVMLRLIGLQTLSTRSKVSLLEVGQSISTWPQLASSVMVGAGVVTETARRILLNQLTVSGRYYVDSETIIKQDITEAPAYVPVKLNELSLDEMRGIIKDAQQGENGAIKDKDVLKALVSDAGAAPSSGNDQPWKWLYSKNKLFLFHEEARSYSFGDYRNMASYTSLGAAIENVALSAHKQNIDISVKLFPVENNKKLVAEILFNGIEQTKSTGATDNLADYIYTRTTNRKIVNNEPAPDDVLQQLQQATESVEGAKVFFKTDKAPLQAIGRIISVVDRIRLMHPHGHYDFFHREMRWTEAQAKATRTGMDINTLEIPQQALMALRLFSDDNIMKVVRDIDGAQAFKGFSIPAAVNSAAMGLVTMPAYTPVDFINGGRAVQRQWLKATQLGYAYQPLIAPLYLFPRIVHGGGEDLTGQMIAELTQARDSFMQLFPGDEKRGEVFLFRIFKGDDVVNRALRLSLDDILFID